MLTGFEKHNLSLSTDLEHRVRFVTAILCSCKKVRVQVEPVSTYRVYVMDHIQYDSEEEDESFEERFISILRVLRCLWDKQSRGYNKQGKRDTAIKMLLVMYQEVDPSATASDVEAYIRSLKDQYVRLNSQKRIEREIRDKFNMLQFMFAEIDEEELLKYPRMTNLGPYHPAIPLPLADRSENSCPPEWQYIHGPATVKRKRKKRNGKGV